MSNATNVAHPYAVCTAVTAACPVAATTLGYYPNRGINGFFAVAFGLAGLATSTLGTWKRTWSYMSFITAGCMLELAGYASRVPLTDNPWNKSAFETQIVAIILAPTIICISIYLTLKHVCLALNPALSRIRPRLYPYVFVPADVSCLLVQAIGGSLAASAGYTNRTLLAAGNHAIIAGIVLQVVVLSVFGLTAADYFVRLRRWFASGDASPEALELWHNSRFRLFLYGVAGAYSAILIRCIYRIAEMAGGWGNRIMQDQPSFIVLEGFMILAAATLLASFPPGFLFPQMKRGGDARRRSKKGSEKAGLAGDTNGTNGTELRSSRESRDGAVVVESHSEAK